MKHWSLFFFFLFYCIMLRAQWCILTSTEIIKDEPNLRADTTQIIVQVSGVRKNDLAAPDQGLCAVRLSFRHPFMKELSIELISPSGRRVILTGGEITASNTPFVSWEVGFVPCNSAALPDVGFSEVWENNQDWLNFKKYVGDYYPHKGCLEDFNQGPVNGNWTVRCIDNDDQGVGRIEEIVLVFCDTEGIECNKCVLTPGRLPSEEIVACQGDPLLASMPQTLFSFPEKKDSAHTFAYAAFNDSIFAGVLNPLQMDTLPAGRYQVCPIEFDSLAATVIPDPGSKQSLISLNQLFFERRQCGEVVDSCLSVRIGQVNDTLRVERFLCPGDGFAILDTVFYQAGVYHLRKNGAFCDSIVQLTLRKVADAITFTKDKPALNCSADSLLIMAAFESKDPVILEYNWSSAGGRFDTIGRQSIRVFDPGRYTLSYLFYTPYAICIDSSTIDITTLGGNEFFTILPDSLTCARDTAELIVSTSAPLANVRWASLEDNSFISLTDRIRVWEQGTYVASVQDQFGCTFSDTLFVPDRRDNPLPIVSFDTITCERREVRIRLLNEPVAGVTFSGPGFFSEDLSPLTSIPGRYTCVVTSVAGCVGKLDFDILADTLPPLFSLASKDIGCGNSFGGIVVTPLTSYTELLWSGPVGTGIGDTITGLSLPGWYTVTMRRKNGCQFSDSLLISYDTIPPVLSIFPPDTLTCLRSMVVLKATSDSPVGNWMWNGQPGGMDSLEVSVPGRFSVSAVAQNGCTGKAVTDVVEDNQLPFISALASTITCKTAESFITVQSSETIANIIWDDSRNPSVPSSQSGVYSVRVAGTYYFSVISSEGCESSGFVRVDLDTISPVIVAYILDTLSCTASSATIGVVVERGINTFAWSGPVAGPVLTDSLILVSEPGTYTVRVTSANGCSTEAQLVVVKTGVAPVVQVYADTLTCFSPEVILQTSVSDPTLSFQWSGPANFTSTEQNPVVNTAGLYSLTVVSLDQCITKTLVLVVADVDVPLVTLPDTMILPCDKSGIQLSPDNISPGVRYIWQLPSGDSILAVSIGVADPGIYVLEAEGRNGCRSVPVRVMVRPDESRPQYETRGDTLTCQRTLGSLQIVQGRPGQQYIWVSPSGNQQIGEEVITSESGMYTLYVIDENECSDTSFVELSIDTLAPAFTIEQEGLLRCGNQKAILRAVPTGRGGDWSFEWTTSSGVLLGRNDTITAEIFGVGEYQLTVTQLGNGCVYSAQKQVEVSAGGVEALRIIRENPLCDRVPSGMLTVIPVSGEPPYEITINGVKLDKDVFTLSSLTAGTYTVLVRDSLGCEVKEDIELISLFDGASTTQQDITILYGDSVTLVPELVLPPSIRGFVWSDRNGILCDSCGALTVRPYINTLYTAIISDGDCSWTAKFLVRVKNDIVDAIPNIFSPAGGNPWFFIPQTRGISSVRRLIIIDKWGENLFYASDLLPGISEMGWDGTFDGKPVQSGVYVVIAELQLEDGTVWKYRGDVTLVR